MSMVWLQNVPGEKPLFWVGSSLQDLMRFPEAVKDEVGIALSVAQFGGKHPSEALEGRGVGRSRDRRNYRGHTYRAVYTVKFEHVVYVLHTFQKKSPTDRKTPESDVQLISRRLTLASENYEARYAKRSK